jgi:hypothetical protein
MHRGLEVVKWQVPDAVNRNRSSSWEKSGAALARGVTTGNPPWMIEPSGSSWPPRLARSHYRRFFTKPTEGLFGWLFTDDRRVIVGRGGHGGEAIDGRRRA